MGNLLGSLYLFPAKITLLSFANAKPGVLIRWKECEEIQYVGMIPEVKEKIGIITSVNPASYRQNYWNISVMVDNKIIELDPTNILIELINKNEIDAPG